MISIDTNILLRAFLKDNPMEAEKAWRIMHNAVQTEGLFVSSHVLLEFVWVLKVKKIARQVIYRAVTILIRAPGVLCAQSALIQKALEMYLKGKADFADYLMYAESLEAGVYHVETFDEAFAYEVMRQ